jgi:hypothetical protein
MTHHTRLPVLIVAVLMLLAISGGTASAATPARTAAAAVTGEFAGNAGHLAGIGLSTNGRRVIAYLCNGKRRHISLAQWFRGPVTRNHIDITNAKGTRLAATATAHAITGTVTLKDGRSAHFTARVITHPGHYHYYGLFRSEETFKGVHYLGGWIFVPRRLVGAPAGTPRTQPGPPFLPRDGGAGIINERTGALIVSPRLHKGTVTVPGLGKFRLTACRQAHC